MVETRNTLARLNVCTVDEFVATVGDVWEHAPWVALAVAGGRPYASVDALHKAMVSAVRALDEADRVALFAGHPELAGADARAGRMTNDSVREQAALSLARLSSEENERWGLLNRQYRERFGFPFILCARRHTRASALRCFERRLTHSRGKEVEATLREIAHITRLRLAERIGDHGLQDIHGRLTTHVLDTSRGVPAEGVQVELFQLTHDEPAPIASAITDARGRTPQPLLSGAPLRTGNYEMRFHVGDYFRGQGPVEADWPFLDVVPVRFAISEPEGDYHVPLTVTPWAYATYRGQ
jgi:2-oxo-4-hydroxy-4-carboxy-5-ureidoimidazoline decarboxylase